MSRYSDDERAAVIRRSRELIERPDPAQKVAKVERNDVVFPSFEDELSRYKREADEATARRAAFEADQREREREQREAAMAASNETWMKRHLSDEREFMSELIGEVLDEVLAEERKWVRKQIAEQLAQLREGAKLEARLDALEGKQRSADGVVRKFRPDAA
jgi:hypothetical protein